MRGIEVEHNLAIITDTKLVSRLNREYYHQHNQLEIYQLLLIPVPGDTL